MLKNSKHDCKVFDKSIKIWQTKKTRVSTYLPTYTELFIEHPKGNLPLYYNVAKGKTKWTIMIMTILQFWENTMYVNSTRWQIVIILVQCEVFKLKRTAQCTKKNIFETLQKA